MRSSKKIAHEITFDDTTTLSSYVSEWQKSVNIELRDNDELGVLHTYDLFLPLEVARTLVEDVAEGIIKHDEKAAEQAAEEAEAESISELD
jgi:hypothetical protein